MSITADNLVTRAREHLTEGDESTKFAPERLYALIPSAIALWAQRTEADPQKSLNFLAETASITITAGVANCVSAMETVGIQSQKVKAADIIVDYGKTPSLPVQFVNSRGRLILGGVQDRYFLSAFFDGKKMFFRNPLTGSTTDFAGSMTIRAVAVPTSLTDIPASTEGELATILAEIARKFNTDGDHAGKVLNMQKQR